MDIFQYGNRETDYLKKQDPRLAEAIKRIGHIEREVLPDLFGALVNSIIGQQITTSAQITIWNRMKEGLREITPEQILACPEERLQSFGLSWRKVGYIREAAKRIVSGQLDLGRLHELTDEQVCNELVKLPGIGVWTAQMLMIFSMQRPDIVSFSDLAVLRGMCQLYGHSSLTKDQFEIYRQRYSPYGTAASLYLWEIARESGRQQRRKKKRVAGNMCYYYGIQTDIGDFTVICDETAVTALEFGIVAPESGKEEKTELICEAERQLTEYARGERTEFQLPLRPEGTEFQKKVWSALLAIPYGETRTYKEIAIMAGSPKGFRAVGMANNRNPVPVLIPCHRVIGADGALVGYGGGLDMKVKLLELEKQVRIS